MKLAITTDVHADVHALRDALAQIERLGCDEIVCAGDLLDWGRFPERTIALLQERRIPTIRGNHDRWAVSEGHDTSGWDLTPRAFAFLEGLPASWTRTIDDVRVAVWHARVKSDMKGIYPDAPATELASQLDRAEADVLVVGHTHLPFARASSIGGSSAIPVRCCGTRPNRWRAGCCSTARAASSCRPRRPAAAPSASWTCRR